MTRTPSARTASSCLTVAVTLFVASCALQQEPPFHPATGPVSAKLADRYRDCLFSATDKLRGTPISADVMISTAEGECRDVYLAYADAVRKELAAGATTSAEKQLAEDQGSATLRQAQNENRRILNDRISLEALTGKSSLKIEDVGQGR